MLDKSFDFKAHEANLYAASEPYFAPSQAKEAYTIMMPPPNVTGALHVGHALTYTIQDIIARFERAQGKAVLWQPGTDHGGISTQLMVERYLATQNKDRQSLGKPAFLKHVWEWKEKYGTKIVEQQKLLRLSADWSRSCFTLDADLSKAVREVFVKLYKDNLIYRDKRLVNWDPELQTAVSDLEVITQEETQPFYHIHYPLSHNNSQHITIATTRPETMFGDEAIAVHPDDERYKHLIGKFVIIPLTNKQIPIIADTYSDPEKGTGAVKITPAHDFNDFEVGKRHNLALTEVIDTQAKMCGITPEKYQGLDVKEARKQVVIALKQQGFMGEISQIKSPMPYGEKSKALIQPLLKNQWFLKADVLAKPALEAVASGKIQFMPAHWQNTYNEWLKNIQPWCISRQIWWGHEIPAWFGPDEKIFVAYSEEEAKQLAKEYYGKNVDLRQDTDVLDTWFSSALWPFSTLGWPNETIELKRFYPTSTLVTGFDIIFFWVARMVMMGLYFMKDVPFKTIYIHPLVRDEKGQKMSKTKGNVIDPLDITEKYGSDTLRFTLAYAASPGNDIRMSEKRIADNRNFLTKIWNAAKLLEMQGCKYEPNNLNHENLHVIDIWLVTEFLKTKTLVTEAYKNYRFDMAAQQLYRDFWHIFCDQYLEALKIVLPTNPVSGSLAMQVFYGFLSLFHPIIPSMTSYLAKYFGFSENLTAELWENNNILDSVMNDSQEKIHIAEMTQKSWRIIDEVRSIKGILGIKGGVQLPATLFYKENPPVMQNVIEKLARISTFSLIKGEGKAVGLPIVVDQFSLYLDISSEMDTRSAINAVQSKLEDLEKNCNILLNKTKNEAFKLARPDVWQEDYTNLQHIQQEAKTLEKILQSLNNS